MNWNVKKEQSGINKNYSLIKILRREGKINKNFLSALDNVTIEEIIAIKLELSARAAGGYLYSFPIFDSIEHMVRDGVYKFALSCTKSKKEAARCIGLTPREFRHRIKKYNIQNELLEESKKST